MKGVIFMAKHDGKINFTDSESKISGPKPSDNVSVYTKSSEDSVIEDVAFSESNNPYELSDADWDELRHMSDGGRRLSDMYEDGKITEKSAWELTHPE